MLKGKFLSYHNSPQMIYLGSRDVFPSVVDHFVRNVEWHFILSPWSSVNRFTLTIRPGQEGVVRVCDLESYTSSAQGRIGHARQAGGEVTKSESSNCSSWTDRSPCTLWIWWAGVLIVLSTWSARNIVTLSVGLSCIVPRRCHPTSVGCPPLREQSCFCLPWPGRRAGWPSWFWSRSGGTEPQRP